MRWTRYDDEVLLQRIEECRDTDGRVDWKGVAQALGGHVSAGAARKRYEVLRGKAMTPYAEDFRLWRDEEDKRLLEIVDNMPKPTRWAEVAKRFGGTRSPNALKKRYYALTHPRTPGQARGNPGVSGVASEARASGALFDLAQYSRYLSDSILAPQRVSIAHSSSGGDPRVTVTAKIVDGGILRAIEDFWRDFESEHVLHKREPRPVRVNGGGYLGLVAPADPHIGKLIWAQATGEDYDVDIACQKFVEHVERSVDKMAQYAGHLQHSILVIGNDFFNINSHEMFATANGTPQKQEDSRVQRTWSKAREAAIRAVEACRGASESVNVIFVPGNHERDLLYYFGEMLAAWFHNEPGISVDNSPSLRKYAMYGNVLLGFTHGSEERIDSLPMIMATECPHLWGEAKYREWVIGHFHRRREMRYMPLVEQGGVTIRVLPPLTATDQWHYLKGFVGSVRASQAVLYNTDEGIAEAVFTTV